MSIYRYSWKLTSSDIGNRVVRQIQLLHLRSSINKVECEYRHRIVREVDLLQLVWHVRIVREGFPRDKADFVVAQVDLKMVRINKPPI